MSLVFSWSARQTWRRGTSNAERAPPPFLNSLAALQGWQNCPQMCHRERQPRRCRVFAQHWSAGMTPPPLIARTNRKRLLFSPGKCSRIVSLFCMPRFIAAHAVIKSPLNAFYQTPKIPTYSHRISRIALTSHVARLVLFTHHTSRPQLLSQFLFASHFTHAHFYKCQVAVLASKIMNWAATHDIVSASRKWRCRRARRSSCCGRRR